MTPEQFEKISGLFHAALERKPAERAEFLTEACTGDEEMRREVALLVAAHEQAGNFIEQPPDAVTGGCREVRPLPEISFPHYRLLSSLGKGGMGEVWLAEDTQLGRKIALKLLPAEFTTDEGRVRRFAQESRAASALNHPNIITIHEIGEIVSGAARTHYIVIEYVVGETLRQLMSEAPQQQMTIVKALDVALQIAAALAAAHEAGIIHRDIKPENVMVRPDGIIKVLDFGLAKLTERPLVDTPTPKSSGDSSEAGVVMGTPRYMSPEQARGEKVDTRTDIFSLGVIVYEMIAGCAPFRGATTSETIAAILRDLPVPLTAHAPAAPAELERIVNKTLHKERAARYQSAGDLLADLKELKQRIDIQTKVSSIGSTFPPAAGSAGRQNVPAEGVSLNVGRKPFDLFASALRAIAAWVRSPRRPVLTEKDLVLLADFENKTGDPVFDGTLKQGLAIQLRQSPFLSLFPDDRVGQTLRLMKRSTDERIAGAIAREICLRHNLKALIAGSIAPLGSHYVITIEAIHGQTGETLENEQVEAKSKEQVLRALSQAARRLRAKLGESLSSIQQFHMELEETTTQQLDAFRAYSLGYEQSLNGRFTDAIQLYRRAVEIDPDFAYAWSMLSIHHSIVGLPGLAAESSQRAYALKDRVSDYEQLQITFRYHFNFTGDLNRAIEAAILFKRMYPRTSTAPIDLLVSYDLLGRHDQAIEEGREALRLNPNFAPAYWYLGRSLLRVSRFDEAKHIFRQALEQKFDLANIHYALYQIACAEGDTAGMQEQLDWAKGKPEENVALGWRAASAVFTGQWRKAQEFARRAIDLAARGATRELAARYATEQALWSATLGDCPRAEANAAQGLKFDSGRASLPRAALALALCGELKQVEPLVDELHQRYPEDTVIHSIWLPSISAALLLHRESQLGASDNGAEQAIDLLQTTTNCEAAAEFWPQTLRGRAYIKLGRSAEAAMEFQKILDHRGQSPLSPLLPLAHLGLARAAALAGDEAKSRKAWEDFSAAWCESDPDLPILIEAKREFNMPIM